MVLALVSEGNDTCIYWFGRRLSRSFHCWGGTIPRDMVALKTLAFVKYFFLDRKDAHRDSDS